MALSIKTGTYTGNATARSITGLGFTPKLVIIMTGQTTGGNGTVFSMATDKTASFGENGQNTGHITSLDSDGFSLGTSDVVNKNSNTYYYVAFGGTDIVTGSYTGNGSDNRSITGVGFQPVWVLVQGGVRHMRHKMNSTGASTDISQFGTISADEADNIQALQADGFQIGGNTGINENTVPYQYACFKSGAQIVNQSYTGNNTDNRDITTTGITPIFVAIKSSSTQGSVFRTQDMPADSTAYCRSNTALASNHIQSFSSGSFQIGSDSNVNANSTTYHSIAFAQSGASFTVSENLALSETLTTSRARLATISETLALSETVNASRGFIFTISETLGLTEVLTTTRTRLIAISETLGITEILAEVKKKWRNAQKNIATWKNDNKSTTTWKNEDKTL